MRVLIATVHRFLLSMPKNEIGLNIKSDLSFLRLARRLIWRPSQAHTVLVGTDTTHPNCQALGHVASGTANGAHEAVFCPVSEKKATPTISPILHPLNSPPRSGFPLSIMAFHRKCSPFS
ncbi:unnamed protein product [Hymenolepis diminuta]|uniref:Uncharacterized protein n=1 Tax=Hymenolepis diminuta TaxID=6216 RepID=A0A564YL56_HYMDI|nr:unnamed protein product [Hymenolepis diminuta]VUZ47947.1 unnamed protein product [Hymenolepis diminuta]